MPEYTVRWQIQTDADSPEEAAQHVRAEYFQLRHNADSFDVIDTKDDLGARWDHIDLTRPDHNGTRWEFSNRALFRMAEKMHEEGDSIKNILYMLEKPHKYKDELTAIILEDEFDKVSPGHDEPDHSDPEV